MILYSEYLRFNEAEKEVKPFTLADDLKDQYGEVIAPLIKNFLALEDPYIVRTRVPYFPSGNPPIDAEDRADAVMRTWDKLNVFFWATAPYYAPLLKAYQDNIDKLMTGLTETREENASTTTDRDVENTQTSTEESNTSENTSGKRTESDTPTSSTFSDFPTATDNLSFGEQKEEETSSTTGGSRNAQTNEEARERGTSQTTATREYDTRYTIDKLNELRTKYRNLMRDWYNELYKEFAVAEANIW